MCEENQTNEDDLIRRRLVLVHETIGLMLAEGVYRKKEMQGAKSHLDYLDELPDRKAKLF